ncbi:PAP2 family protein [Ancylomarina salipaludis]|uniref:PAP2 family protein n=1 Tax=Ancylomarina salipaludis TaxID=2501299 RepID=A0A4Q1JN74_9BACT|nr:PAP2 family protein [Ancylomarina salipaludis]RXQ95103.1 PAP2 family protein [Ancylomarina salipaludis]
MNLSRIISGLAHPMLMPLYALYLIFHSDTFLDFTPFTLVKAIYLIVFITTVLLPISCLPLLKSYSLISSFDLSERRDRMIPLALAVLSYSLGFYLLSKLPGSNIFARLQLAGIFSLLLLLITSYWWKISLHMAGIGGLCALIFTFSVRFSTSLRTMFMMSLLAAGFLAYSRLKLNRHTSAQIYVGFMFGFIVVFLTFIYK